MKDKYFVLGNGGHGKDDVAKVMVKHLGLKFKSSSMFACERIVYPALKDKYGYKNVDECYNDRRNHRKEWYDLIKAYNTPDLARLGRELFKEYDVYVGLRDYNEFKAIMKEVEVKDIIWVDASKRVPLESIESFNIPSSVATKVVDNNESLHLLTFQVLNALKEK